MLKFTLEEITHMFNVVGELLLEEDILIRKGYYIDGLAYCYVEPYRGYFRQDRGFILILGSYDTCFKSELFIDITKPLSSQITEISRKIKTFHTRVRFVKCAKKPEKQIPIG
jgi:hypothetical protein